MQSEPTIKTHKLSAPARRHGMHSNIGQQAELLATRALEAAATASNEFQLQHVVEGHMESACRALGIAWVPYSINVSLRRQGQNNRPRFSDAVHGAVIIEYKTPRAFSGMDNHVLKKAKGGIEDYAKLMQSQEGRPVEEYTLLAWDGNHIDFGKIRDGVGRWERLVPFDSTQAMRLLRILRENGRPLVHPDILSQLVGPGSHAGTTLIPVLYNALLDATKTDRPTTRTKLLFTEWRRLFGQVIGAQSSKVQKLIKNQGIAHGINYQDHVPQYIMALSTHIALVAKLVAARSLPNTAIDVTDSAADLKARLQTLEDGSLFRDAGITNILSGDFFAWYLDEAYWHELKQPINAVVATLQHIDFNIESKNLSSVRDLFKGMYETFMPKALRHAMGEFYTPNWLAAHALDNIEWTPRDQLLDPTCGTGTFLLEAIKRRLTLHEGSKEEPPNASQLLDGIYGMDLNPLAVLAARASIIVFLSPYITPETPLTIPVWLADAINSPARVNENFEYELLTEKGIKSFRVPSSMVENPDFHRIFVFIMELINADMETKAICSIIRAQFDLKYLTTEEIETFDNTVERLVSLHEDNWDGIWCPILAERFAAGAIPRVSHIVGNPPWVKWSHLPPEYADFIKDRCRRSMVFSDDAWLGGIESDISTVITFEAIKKWLRAEGKVAFFITGTVFANKSSQGFRRMQYDEDQCAAFEAVEDFKAVAPFEGVSNHPTLMTLHNGKRTDYPVRYRIWKPNGSDGQNTRAFESWEDFEKTATFTDLLARPVYGSNEGPWLKGTASQHGRWPHLFNVNTEPSYTARKGVSTDSNGIFFVAVSDNEIKNACSIANDPALGRTPGIQQVRMATVETEHVFPLIRGRGISSFVAQIDPEYCILVPQRTMHGNPELPKKSHHTFRYLSRFKAILEKRSSYRRYQKGQPFWSLWNVGAYTFAPYKVVWKEMSGNRFQAAYIGSMQHDILGNKLIIPDHKLYFVPLWDEDEAAYLTGMLNAPSVAEAVSAYSPRLSLGTSVVKHLAIPKYNHKDLDHRLVAGVSKRITQRGDGPRPANLQLLDEIAENIFTKSGNL